MVKLVVALGQLVLLLMPLIVAITFIEKFSRKTQNAP